MNNNKNISEILERIKEFKRFSSDTAVAEALEMSTTALAEHKRRGTIPFKQLFKFSEKESVSLDWLLIGEGEMYRQPSTPSSLAGEGRGEGIKEVMYQKDVDPELVEIMEMLKEYPQDKKLVLKLLKGKKDIKEALEGFGVKRLVEDG